jgi:hypothetical protein
MSNGRNFGTKYAPSWANQRSFCEDRSALPPMMRRFLVPLSRNKLEENRSSLRANAHEA